MKITVCFKVVTDYDKVSPKDFKRGDFSYVKKDFGFFDEGALELALSFKDEYPDTTLEALTFGERDEIAIEKLYSLNFDEVTVIPGKEEVFNPKEVGRVLGTYLKENSSDLILTGEMVGPNDSSLVPYYLGKELGIKVIPKVTHFTKDKVYSEDNLSIYENVISDKLILIITNSVKPYLRFPKYRDIEEAKNKKENIVKINSSFENEKISLNTIKKKEAKDIDVKLLLKEISEVGND